MKIQLIVSVPFDECVQTSAKEFGEQMGVDYAVANGLLKFLEAKGVATCKPHKVEGQKGKPTNIYTVPTCIQLTFHEEVAAKVA